MPRNRDEDALTYAFLAFIERLSQKTKKKLFKSCGIEGLNLDSELDIEFQLTLRDGSRPDGFLSDNERVVCFENKVDQSHTTEQLSRYFNQVKKEFKDLNTYLLVGVDTSNQSRLVTQSIIEKSKIPEEVAFILAWQEVYLSCKNLVEESKEGMSEVDIFLLKEFASLLEEMNMIPYIELTKEDLEGFNRTHQQISILQSHLKQEIPRLLPELQLFNKRNSYSNIFADWLGFQFKGARGSGYSYVYLYMNKTSDTWEVGIWIEEENDRRKILRKMDLESFIQEFERVGAYYLKCGYNGEIEVDSSGIRKFLKEKSKQLEEHFEIHRVITFEDLENVYGLKTSEFPEKITKEILNLRGFIEIISSALQRKGK